MQRKPNDIYVGTKAEAVLAQINRKNPEFKAAFLDKLFQAYLVSSEYVIQKFPLNNNLLKCLSAIDPKAQGHAITQSFLKKLPSFFPTVILDVSDYNTEIRQL